MKAPSFMHGILIILITLIVSRPLWALYGVKTPVHIGSREITRIASPFFYLSTRESLRRLNKLSARLKARKYNLYYH